MHNILVISNRTCECPVVIDEIERHAREAEQATVVNVHPGSGWLLANVACSRRAVQKEAVVRDDDGVLEVERLQLVDGHSNLFQ